MKFILTSYPISGNELDRTSEVRALFVGSMLTRCDVKFILVQL